MSSILESKESVIVLNLDCLIEYIEYHNCDIPSLWEYCLRSEQAPDFDQELTIRVSFPCYWMEFFWFWLTHKCMRYCQLFTITDDRAWMRKQTPLVSSVTWYIPHKTIKYIVGKITFNSGPMLFSIRKVITQTGTRSFLSKGEDGLQINYNLGIHNATLTQAEAIIHLTGLNKAERGKPEWPSNRVTTGQ